MLWAIELNFKEEEQIDTRLSEIVRYVIEEYKITHCILYDIDATGPKGNQLTKEMNLCKNEMIVAVEDIKTTISEDGQIFELDLYLKNSIEFRFKVRDGNFVLIFGSKDRIPNTVIGDYNNIQASEFL